MAHILILKILENNIKSRNNLGKENRDKG